MHPPKIWEENGGVFYSLDVAYLAGCGKAGGGGGAGAAGGAVPRCEARSGVPLRQTTVLGRGVQVVQAR